MKLDFASMAFGYKVKVGGGTPNWATSLGQGKGYKINPGSDIQEILKGMVYSSVSLGSVSSKIGKGGKVVRGNEKESPIILAALFSKVFVNETLINNGKFVMILTRDDSKSHAGRLRFKYGPSNTYLDENGSYSNELFLKNTREQLGLEEDACWFVYDISVRNQDELLLSAVIVNPYGTKEYVDSTDLHTSWEELIEENEKNNPNRKNTVEIYEGFVTDYTPEWFAEKAFEYKDLDSEAETFRIKFLTRFSWEKLKALNDEEILETIFLNPNNKSNLCYVLEYNNDCRNLFGSIKNGTAYKYGLHYSKKYNSWVTGTGRNVQMLSEEEAIELGVKIRDYLVAGANVISLMLEKQDISDYEELYDKLNEETDGFINRVWFLKYYAILFPTVFPPSYSVDAQNTIICNLGLDKSDNSIIRMGYIKEFILRCGISGVVFNRIFWKYCNNKEDEIMEERVANCFDVEREARKNKTFPLNTIIYGAPGTGKTYSTAEYALSIIQEIPLEDFQKDNKDRKLVMKQYNELVKSGQIVFTTFHQSYGYEDFIQGLRPDMESEEMVFKPVNGVFKKIADNALYDFEKNYVIIIDEINRANISKVFGELITLIEEDKRWGEVNQTSVTLQSGDVFAVPNNLYIVGTMNSADKSISLIDAALRRRFEFVEQKPDSSLVKDEKLKDVLDALNLVLADQLKSSDLLIGHSYFMNKSKEDLPKILNNSVIPLLYEYFYDNKKKVMGVLNNSINQTDYIIQDDKLGRVYVEVQKNKDDTK